MCQPFRAMYLHQWMLARRSHGLCILHNLTIFGEYLSIKNTRPVYTGMFLVLFDEQFANKKIMASDKNEQYEILKKNILYCSQI